MAAGWVRKDYLPAACIALHGLSVPMKSVTYCMEPSPIELQIALLYKKKLSLICDAGVYLYSEGNKVNKQRYWV
jgi:hypothetical protein